MPYFLRSENNDAYPGSPYHGQGGPMNVIFVKRPNPMTPAFLAAMEGLGFKRNRRLQRPELRRLRAAAGHHPEGTPRIDGDRVSASLRAARARISRC